MGHTTSNHVTLGLGCANIAGLYAPVSPHEARDALETAWAKGIRRFDTAPFYGRGLSERRVGDFLREKQRVEFVLSTKVGRRLVADGGADVVADDPAQPLPFRVEFDYSYDGIMRSIEDSFQRTGLTRFDILYVHDIGVFAHGDDAPRHLKILLDSGMKALDNLKSDGSISAYGLGVNENEVCVEVLARVPLDQIMLAGRYTLLDRTAERELLPLCVETGTEIVVAGMFNSGILATGASGEAWFNYMPADQDIRDRVNKIEAVCTRFGVSMAETALNFAASHPAVSTLIMGTHKAKTIIRTFEQFTGQVDPELLAEIDPFTLR